MTQSDTSVLPVSRLSQPGLQRQGAVVLFGEVLADVFPDRSVLGGAPFNVACHLQAFGRHPVLISRLGEDALRDAVMHAMSEKGLDTQGVQFDTHYPTGQVKVHMQAGGHRFEILPLQAYDFIHADAARQTLTAAQPDLVYFGTLTQRHAVSRQALHSLLQAGQSMTFLDINLRAPWYDEATLRLSLQFADIVKINDAELTELADLFALPGGSPHEQSQALMAQFDLAQVLVTCGDAGAWHLSREGTRVESGIPGAAIRVVDTVGAGDGFASVFILGFLRDWAMSTTLERANTFAAAICGIRGAVPEHAAFYDSFKEAWGV